MTLRYMLDTNTVGRLVRRDAVIARRKSDVPDSTLCISVITEAELLYGLANQPQAVRLAALVREFLASVRREPWTSVAAERYGALRAGLKQRAITMSPNDMLIAAHAMALDAVLVTSDRAFRHVDELTIEDWLGD